MKHLIPACICTVALAFTSNAQAQEALSYEDMLSGTKEIRITDSLNFSAAPDETISLDSVTVTKWFPQLLSTGANKFKNKTYSLLGKITTEDKFDMLLLLEDKKRTDSSEIQVTYLITTKKNGDYIASIKAAVTGTKKKSGYFYNISSCLYSDLKIVQDSRIMTNNNLSYNDMVSYRISNGGRFIIQ